MEANGTPTVSISNAGPSSIVNDPESPACKSPADGDSTPQDGQLATYTAGAHVEGGRWLRKADAARALRTSKTTVARKAERGELPSRRLPDGSRLFLVSAGGVREMAKVKAKADGEALTARIAVAVSRGRTVEDLCADGISPSAIAKAVRELADARLAVRQAIADQRAADAAARYADHLEGRQQDPRSWAWASLRLGFAVSFAAARKEFEKWTERGNSRDDACGFVLDAIASEADWEAWTIRWRHELAESERRHAEAEDMDYERARKVVAENEKRVAAAKLVAAKGEAIDQKTRAAGRPKAPTLPRRVASNPSPRVSKDSGAEADDEGD